MYATIWAAAAFMQPIAVGIKAVLDVVFTDFNLIFTTKFGRQMPGFGLQFQKFQIASVILMFQQGVGQLVQYTKFKFPLGLFSTKGDCFGVRRPVFAVAILKFELRIVSSKPF